MHIVSYKRIAGFNSYGADIDPTRFKQKCEYFSLTFNSYSWVKPMHWYSSYKYEDLDNLADVYVGYQSL